MYCSRPVQRSPGAIRIISRAPRQCRQASYYPSSSFSISPFYARPTAPLDPFRGFERLLEDITSPSFQFGFPQQLQQLQQQQQQQQQLAHHQQTRTFAPRFDVQEQAEAYELRGEIPGVEAKDLEVDFRDAQTLVIRGRTENESSSGSRPETGATQTSAETEVAETAPEADQSDAASVHSTGSYQKPTVEDATEPAAEDTDAASAVSEAQATPATTPGGEVQAQAPQAQAAQAPQQQQQQQQSHYWNSERSTGSFQRMFKFPQRVDQEGVTASLKNGVLRVVMPKAGVQEVRRIVVQ